MQDSDEMRIQQKKVSTNLNKKYFYRNLFYILLFRYLCLLFVLYFSVLSKFHDIFCTVENIL